MRVNRNRVPRRRTYEGGQATVNQSPEMELERAVASCLLFEDTFYESGVDIAERIASLCRQVPPAAVAALAVKARTEWGLRHVPLWLARQLARGQGALVGDTIAQVIRRADELAEFLALYWKEGRQPLSAQTKRGLRMAFQKFSAYELAKYNRRKNVRLRDVAFLCHAKPKDAEQGAVFANLVNKSFFPEQTKSGFQVKTAYGVDGKPHLNAPDTWEVNLSAGADKKDTFERLLTEQKLGYLALLRNLRTMDEVGVSRALVMHALRCGNSRGILPFQFVAAWRAAPAFADGINAGMVASLRDAPRLDGSTAIVVDVSGSMDAALSARSALSRIDAGAAVAVLIREVCQDARVFTFSDSLCEVPATRGLALVEAIHASQPHAGTYLRSALTLLRNRTPGLRRLVIITDEQAHDGLPACWAIYGYLINCASYRPALETEGRWQRINGFSERIVDWIRVSEDLSDSKTDVDSADADAGCSAASSGGAHRLL